MLTWYRNNRPGALGVMACLLFGGIEVLIFLIDGVKRADLNTPAGSLAHLVASQFTEGPSLYRAGTDRRELTYRLVVGWQAILTAVYASLTWMASRARRGSRRVAWISFAQAALGAFGMSALLYVLAAQHAVTMPPRRALAWLALQIALLACAFTYMMLFGQLELGDDTIRIIWMYAVLGLVFQVITYGAAYAAVRAQATRRALATANATLLATQSMLADTVRSSERTRIARDLHDAIGHHLTALNLHLDLALRQSGRDAPPALSTSRELARSLLSEVRLVVSSARSEQRIDLGAAIATMCAGIPAPSVRLRIDEPLDIGSAAAAHTLFFCTQEALTNAIRHSGAGVVDVCLRAVDGEVRLHIGDDGAGAHGAPEGNGMRGMRERVAALGGTLHAGARAEGGFGLDIALPLAGSAA